MKVRTEGTGMGGSSAMHAGRPPSAGISALRALVAACALAVVAVLLAGTTAHAQAQAPPVKVLVFHGPSDARTDAGVAALEAIGAANDIDVDATANATAFTAGNLAGYRAVVFLNTSGNILDTAQERALEGYIEDGGGFLGIGETAEAEEGNSF